MMGTTGVLDEKAEIAIGGMDTARPAAGGEAGKPRDSGPGERLLRAERLLSYRSSEIERRAAISISPFAKVGIWGSC